MGDDITQEQVSTAAGPNKKDAKGRWPMALAVAMLFILVAVLASRTGGTPPRPEVDVLGYGHAFEGDVKLPRETIKKELDATRDVMKERMKASRAYARVQVWLQWTGFLLGAVVTVIAGFHWHGDGREMDLAALKKALGKKANGLRTAGAVSALATVLVLAAAKCGEASAKSYHLARETRDKLNLTVADLQKARTAEEAQSVLDELALYR